MNQKRKKNLVVAGAIGLIALACVDWLIVIGLLFVAFIIWAASIHINREEDHDVSTFFISRTEHKAARTPVEYGAGTHLLQVCLKLFSEVIYRFELLQI